MTVEERRAAHRAYYQRNRERILAHIKAYRAANPDVIRERNRRYAQENPERIKQGSKASYEKNKAKHHERAKKRRETKRDELNAWAREHYKRNRVRHCAATNRRSLMREYGITPERKAEMLSEQAGCCALCQRNITGEKMAHVDHDHSSGRVRGLLCSSCNRGLGYLGDSPQRLWAALAYLDETDVRHPLSILA